MEEPQPDAGLGEEKNKLISEALTQGDFAALVDIIAAEPETDKACKVVLISMFEFHHVDRATDSHSLARAAIEQNPEVMAALIRHSYHTNKTTERFWLNPYDSTQMLLVDRDGNVISFPEATRTIQKGIQGAGERYIERLESYTLLTGPDKGQTFQNKDDRGIPELDAG